MGLCLTGGCGWILVREAKFEVIWFGRYFFKEGDNQAYPALREAKKCENAGLLQNFFVFAAKFKCCEFSIVSV